MTMPHRFGDLRKSSSALAELVTSGSLPAETGLCYDRSTNAVPSSDLSYNTENAQRLWQVSEELTGLKPKS